MDAARWRVLALICFAIVLSMTTWFSATAITPELTRTWHLSSGQAAWLTNAVQLGFVCGALGASVTGLPDLVPPRALMGSGALAAAGANLLLLHASGLGAAAPARFVTGFALAFVYPPALKLIATWFQRGRGFALGAVIAALTVGSAAPHLLRTLSDHPPWRFVVGAASLATAVGAVLLVFFGREGPYPFSRARFDPRQLGAVVRNRSLALVNLGYFGHMWELYAMWSWYGVLAGEVLPRHGFGTRAASLTTFAVIASGSLGALAGGVVADRFGRRTAAGAMLALSAGCAAAIGFAAAGPLPLFLAVSVLWGVSIIGDSAQFSAMATEVTDQRFVGTALALQLGVGFALTAVSIRLTPLVAGFTGWRWCFLLLLPGPLAGLAAMRSLSRAAPA